MLGGNQYSIQGGLEMLLVDATETGDKRRSDGPLGSYAGFAFVSASLSSSVCPPQRRLVGW